MKPLRGFLSGLKAAPQPGGRKVEREGTERLRENGLYLQGGKGGWVSTERNFCILLIFESYS